MDLGLLGLDFDFPKLAFIMARMVGCIYFNPILGQRSVPNRLKAALTLFMSIFVYTGLPDYDSTNVGLIVFAFIIVKEVLIGFLAGFAIRLFMSVITIGGELTDFNIGLSMAKVFDPMTRNQVAISSSLFNVMFMCIFFATNSHLTLMKFFCVLGEVAPYGEFAISKDFLWAFTELFSLIVLYAIKFTLPIVAIEIITETCVGLLMKAVPNINILTLNIEIKMFVGIICIIFLVPSYANFLEKLIELMFDKLFLLFGVKGV